MTFLYLGVTFNYLKKNLIILKSYLFQILKVMIGKASKYFSKYFLYQPTMVPEIYILMISMDHLMLDIDIYIYRYRYKLT